MVNELKIPRVIREFYYITHIDNIPSIASKGILAHKFLTDGTITPTQIYEKDIVSRRQDIETPDKKKLWEYANLFFNAKNAMLYRVVCEKGASNLAIVAIAKEVVLLKDVFITDGNAAHSLTKFFKPETRLLSEIAYEASKVFWREDGSKRKNMAECLIPEKVAPQFIEAILVAKFSTKQKVDQSLGKDNKIPIVNLPDLFFLPLEEHIVPPNIRVRCGDMFFSRAQTLTISVNTVGVMGAGLAARAKYQFPDVFLFYQTLCKDKRLRMGQPYLFNKLELSADEQLADEPDTLKCSSGPTWFLLFPTKRHWKEQADIQGIEEGLQWVVNNYKDKGIKSLAMPALGCGLGGLDWKDVGPLMCNYLSKLDIPVFIYLPNEKDIPYEQKTPSFLLPRTK
jgi:O-acetyl-ADP-ribose deacetylase (regulator of RNase III)